MATQSNTFLKRNLFWAILQQDSLKGGSSFLLRVECLTFHLKSLLKGLYSLRKALRQHRRSHHIWCASFWGCLQGEGTLVARKGKDRDSLFGSQGILGSRANEKASHGSFFCFKKSFLGDGASLNRPFRGWLQGFYEVPFGDQKKRALFPLKAVLRECASYKWPLTCVFIGT